MATIVMESSKVIEAADAVIKSIRNERILRDEKCIENAMKPQKRWFRKNIELTREQAIEYLDKIARDNMFANWRSHAGACVLEKAKTLRKLAQHGDPVTLNEKDIEVLF
jgi:hypothetical protein